MTISQTLPSIIQPSRIETLPTMTYSLRARVEKSPWGMRVKGAYDLLAGPLPLSQPFNDFYRPRAQSLGSQDVLPKM